MLCVICIIVLLLYWYNTKPGYYKKVYQKLKQIKGFKHSHLTNQPEEVSHSTPISNTAMLATHTNCHMLIYGTSGAGKTSYLKYYLDQTKSNFIVFGKDETEFHSDKYVPLLQIERIEIEPLANKTVKLDDAGAYKSLETKVEDLFRFGRHHKIQVIYLAH